MLDTDIHDTIAVDEEFARRIKQCQAAGHITLQSTHIQQEEIADIPTDRDIGQANVVDTQRIGASVLVWGKSLWGEDRWGTKDMNEAFVQLQKGNLKHTEDAMIGVTALTDADILVTNDQRFRTKFQSLTSRVIVMSSEEFAAFLQKFPA
ncbi:MAG: hypothetical protein HY244_02415 [Rhizobiales bacterium]|nr:hypothetical protein [Hyphomicrobiales bacterium]